MANELEYRGFRVSDLNKEGTSANADLLAAKDGETWQIQVKGSTEEDGFWFGYGHCNEAIIAGTEPMFNRSLSFYKAHVVVLVSVKSPKEYSCLVLPVDIANEAAKINLDREYRSSRKDGGVRKPGKVWMSFDPAPSTMEPSRKSLYLKEQEMLRPFLNTWGFA